MSKILEIMERHPSMTLILRSEDKGLITEIFGDGGHLMKVLSWGGPDDRKEIVFEMDRGTIETYANWLRERE